jgi:predicted hotdog family 3-hydroxylacyl-ACP dehydratase
MPKIDKEELLTLLPHRGKMFLLSRVNDYDTKKRTLTAEYDITPECLFYDGELDGVPSWAGFEFMAQGVSAVSGISFREEGVKPKPGFILSVTGMETMIPVFKAGTTVTIRVEEDCRIDAVNTFDCRLRIGEEQAASAKVTVMDVDDLSVYQKENNGN